MTGQGARPTRRERLRRSTYDEIVATARAAVGKGEAISLRAVAAEMGMATSALYRYVDSHGDLQRLVANRIYEDVVATMSTAAGVHDDPAARAVASLCAFRRWALRHRAEFLLVFSPVEGEGLGRYFAEDFEAVPASLAFAVYFVAQTSELLATGRAHPPADRPLSPRARAAMVQLHKQWGGDPRFPDLSLEQWWLQYANWSRLLGTLTLEVTGQVPAPLIETAALFEQALYDAATAQGLDADDPALRALLQAELDRRD